MQIVESLDLEQIIDTVERFANENGIQTLHGSISTDQVITMQVSDEKYSLEDFLQILLKLKVEAILLEYLVVDEGGEFGISDAEVKRIITSDIRTNIRKMLKDWKRKKGSKFMLTIIGWTGRDLTYEYIYSTPIFDEYMETKGYIDEIKRFFLKPYHTTVNEPGITMKEIRSKGKVLSKDERFQLAKNERQRKVILNELFEEDDLDEMSRTEILIHATTYYDVDIKPKEEKKMMQRVQKLKGDGLSKSKIANNLGVSTYTIDKYF